MEQRRPQVIGMLGGMSWQSTVKYYQLANELVSQRLGGVHSARLQLASVDFAEIEELQRAGQWREAGDQLATLASGLQAAGADLVLICANTMHKVADQVQAVIDVPLLHLADVTATAVTRAGLHRVGLLGTTYTMEQDFYTGRLAAHHLQVLVPEREDRAAVHRIILDELVRGELREESRQMYREVIGRLVGAGAQGVILGCTEIELLIDAADAPVPVFPTTALHVAAAVDVALGDAEPVDFQPA